MRKVCWSWEGSAPRCHSVFLTPSVQHLLRLASLIAAPPPDHETKPLARPSRAGASRIVESLGKRSFDHANVQQETIQSSNDEFKSPARPSEVCAAKMGESLAKRQSHPTRVHQVTLSDDEPKLAACPSGDKAAPKKSARNIGCVGVSNAYNFGPSKARKKISDSSSSSFVSRRGSKEAIANQRNTTSFVTTSQIAQANKSAPLAFNTNSNVKLITECATTWSIVGFLLSSMVTVYEVSFILTGDKKNKDFYGWIVMPISTSAMAVSFVLKPRKNDLPYKVFLHFQYFFFTFGSLVSAFMVAIFVLLLLTHFILAHYS